MNRFCVGSGSCFCPVLVPLVHYYFIRALCRDSSYSMAYGAVIFLSKWAVFCQWSIRGDFQPCWEAVCCDWFEYTVEICTGPDTQTHTAGDDTCICLVSSLHWGRRQNIFGPLITATTSQFVSITHRLAHMYTASRSFLLCDPNYPT